MGSATRFGPGPYAITSTLPSQPPGLSRHGSWERQGPAHWDGSLCVWDMAICSRPHRCPHISCLRHKASCGSSDPPTSLPLGPQVHFSAPFGGGGCLLTTPSTRWQPSTVHPPRIASDHCFPQCPPLLLSASGHVVSHEGGLPTKPSPGPRWAPNEGGGSQPPGA